MRVETLGGAAALTVSARDTKAFRRARMVRDPLILLRLVLAYCLGDHSLRLTAAMGLAHLSNVGLLYRLQQCDAWLRSTWWVRCWPAACRGSARAA